LGGTCVSPTAFTVGWAGYARWRWRHFSGPLLWRAGAGVQLSGKNSCWRGGERRLSSTVSDFASAGKIIGGQKGKGDQAGKPSRLSQTGQSNDNACVRGRLSADRCLSLSTFAPNGCQLFRRKVGPKRPTLRRLWPTSAWCTCHSIPMENPGFQPVVLGG
jgi:hypothetical protein